MNENEIIDVNIDNAFDLLTSSGFGEEYQGYFEMSIETFRHYSLIRDEYLEKLRSFIENHRQTRVSEFIRLWDSGKMSDCLKLFCSYICDEQVTHIEITHQFREKIRRWEELNELDSTLENTYSSCVNSFFEFGFTYEDERHSQFVLFPSVKELLFNPSHTLTTEFTRVKDVFKDVLPF